MAYFKVLFQNSSHGVPENRVVSGAEIRTQDLLNIKHDY